MYNCEVIESNNIAVNDDNDSDTNTEISESNNELRKLFEKYVENIDRKLKRSMFMIIWVLVVLSVSLLVVNDIHSTKANIKLQVNVSDEYMNEKFFTKNETINWQQIVEKKLEIYSNILNKIIEQINLLTAVEADTYLSNTTAFIQMAYIAIFIIIITVITIIIISKLSGPKRTAINTNYKLLKAESVLTTTKTDSTPFVDQRQTIDIMSDTNGLSTTANPVTNNSHLELLVKTVSDAHARTCLRTTEQIADSMRKQQDVTRIAYFKNLVNKLNPYSMRKQQDVTRIAYFKNLSHEEKWLECAFRLTDVVKQIIEFAKMVPGFMKLSREDQIVLIKDGSFELCCLRMSRYYDLTHEQVLFGDGLMPMDAFLTQDATELKLVTQAFELAKYIAQMKLTETELALFSACTLTTPDRIGLRGIGVIQRLNQAIVKALRFELNRTQKMPNQDISVFYALMAKIPLLKDLNCLHMEALEKFRRASPHLEFPPLHNELFSIDI